MDVIAATYHVRAERSGRFWAVHVTDLDLWTQARHLRELEVMARDLIAGQLDVSENSFELDVDIVTPPAAAEHLARSAELAAEAELTRARATAEIRAAARLLHDGGLAMRDVGELLGLSHQRVQQLLASGDDLRLAGDAAVVGPRAG